MPLAPLPDELVEFLKGPHAAVISTVRSDGAPYSAATWYDWDDGCILVNMDFERLRLTHMRRDPRVAITVIDLGDWYRAVTVLGTVVEIHDDEGLRDIRGVHPCATPECVTELLRRLAIADDVVI